MNTTTNTYEMLAISDLDSFVFGRSPGPVRARREPTTGAGTVDRELDFTLVPIRPRLDRRELRLEECELEPAP